MLNIDKSFLLRGEMCAVWQEQFIGVGKIEEIGKNRFSWVLISSQELYHKRQSIPSLRRNKISIKEARAEKGEIWHFDLLWKAFKIHQEQKLEEKKKINEFLNAPSMLPHSPWNW